MIRRPHHRRRVLGGLLGLTACAPITTDVDVTVILPDNRADLERTNNVSLVLSPDGTIDTFATDGLDFVLSVELDPDSTERELSLFLARDETLLAWGTTPPFTLLGADAGLAVLVARPGALSALPTQFDAPDPDALAAPIAGRGVAVLTRDGGTTVVDAYTYGTVDAEALSAPPDPADGLLVDDPAAGVQRIAAAAGLRAARLDPATGTWSDRALGESDLGPRPDASWAVDGLAGRVLIIGGAGALDTVAIALDPDATPAVELLPQLVLDAPRPGATAIVAGEASRPITLVFGSDLDDGAVAWWLEGQRALGPSGSWVGARCVPLEDGPTVRILCAGGLRDGAPTGDAIELGFGATGEPVVTERPALLAGPVADPRWLADELAVYAQGAGRMWRVDRADGTVVEVAAASDRGQGGSVTRLPTGFSLLVGGRDNDGVALTQWLVFAPNPVTDAG
jgi:hypothetical protein